MVKEAREYTVGSSVSTEKYQAISGPVYQGANKHGMMTRINGSKTKASKVNYGMVILVCVFMCACVWGMHMDSVELAIGAIK